MQCKTAKEAIEPFKVLLKGLMLIILTLELKFKFVKQENTRARKHFAHTLYTHDLIPSHDRTSALVRGTFCSERVTFHS